MSPHMDYLQAENQLRTFAQETGGFAWFPQFDGEIPDIFRSVAAFLRHQYSLSFTPSGGGKDGKFHKVKVERSEEHTSELQSRRDLVCRLLLEKKKKKKKKKNIIKNHTSINTIAIKSKNH